VNPPTGIERDPLTGVVPSRAAPSGAEGQVLMLSIDLAVNANDFKGHIPRRMRLQALRGPRTRLSELIPRARGGTTMSSHAAP
jgi:hypothetical protein